MSGGKKCLAIREIKRSVTAPAAMESAWPHRQLHASIRRNITSRLSCLHWSCRCIDRIHSGCGWNDAVYERRAFEAVQKRGGLAISDEVQTGFGRLGSHFWGFESKSVLAQFCVRKLRANVFSCHVCAKYA
ncbi:hypothetical protein COOONC_23059 [Cooperia oncophora]